LPLLRLPVAPKRALLPKKLHVRLKMLHVQPKMLLPKPVKLHAPLTKQAVPLLLVLLNQLKLLQKMLHVPLGAQHVLPPNKPKGTL